MTNIHPEWQPLLSKAIAMLDKNYWQALQADDGWLPGMSQIFNAFQQPLSKTRYILLGESPYPRAQSANGFAFWDAAVGELWSLVGLSKPVNRATSFRNLIKMLLHARGDLQAPFTQEAITALDKSAYVKTAEQFFTGMMQHGFMLLNATLVFKAGRVNADAKAWRPFMAALFEGLIEIKPEIKFVLLGKIAQQLCLSDNNIGLSAMHPYNIDFIEDQAVLDFFRPFDLLAPYCHNDVDNVEAHILLAPA